MSEYRTPEEDTIGGHREPEGEDERGVPAERGAGTEPDEDDVPEP
ncbi:MAG TPA: hypothetical protein VGQ15_03935 [Gaiellaceae bacterium]|jgi:hypothetical protein|nr:hypothetical protein [Gaiellaceae bacterium]